MNERDEAKKGKKLQNEVVMLVKQAKTDYYQILLETAREKKNFGIVCEI